MSKLVAGPYVGELGFEVGNWVPHLAAVVEQNNISPDDVYAFTRRGRECLYPFSNNVCTFNFKYNDHPDQNWMIVPTAVEKQCFEKLENKVINFAKDIGADTIISNEGLRETRFTNRIPFTPKCSDELKTYWENFFQTDLPIIVLPIRGYKRGASKNSSVDLINQLIEFLCDHKVYPVIIGHTEDGYHKNFVGGCNLINMTNLNDVVAIYNLASVVIGASTGTMHLASACSISHIVWGGQDGDPDIKYKYTNEWNLNGTLVNYIYDRWDVPFSCIAAALEEIL